ncbi:hypothetical protein B0A49_09296 [Cryomyces minteri]|uniref:Uncharacterized protein n=1 Tax=Cryomyces minteri TaxID=331657 RepID=A0A4U0WL89_9PEZI|nr:hypothetical protein B0A49_09296 [Cryomyces minteri]
MEPHVLSQDDPVQLSGSPARSPQIAQGPGSPVKSVHLEMMDSILNQPDHGHRTADFFDDSSDSDTTDPGFFHSNAATAGGDTAGRRGSSKASYLGATPAHFVTQCEEKKPSPPEGMVELLRLTPATPDVSPYLHQHSPESGGTSYEGSGDEMAMVQARHVSMQVPPGPGRLVDHHSPRTSTVISDERDLRPGPSASKADQILGVHAITMRALLQHDDNISGNGSPSSYRSTHGFDLNAPLPDVQATARNSRAISAPPRPSVPKRVSIAPLPIDTSTPRRCLPENIVRTPFPFYHSKNFSKPSPLSATSSQRDSLLTVSIRRHNLSSALRTAYVTIPAVTDFAPTRTPHDAAAAGTDQAKRNPRFGEKHFQSLDFDDAALFHALRSSYARLVGRTFRLLGARTLKRIVVVSRGYPTPNPDGSAHPHSSPDHSSRSSDPVLSDAHLAAPSTTFSEAKLLAHFRAPGRGRAKYAWVHRLRRFASSPSSPQLYPPSPRSPRPLSGPLPSPRHRRLDGAAAREHGLEFVLGWSAGRIVAALGVVGAASVAVALAWVFAGPEASGTGGQGGMGMGMGTGGGRAERVGTAVLMAICALLLGLVGVGGWMGVAWVVV